MKNAPKKRIPAKKVTRLSAWARRLLGMLLDLEIDGTPAELHTWRAKNATKIPLLDELRRHHMWEGDTHAHVNFWGLLNARGPRAERVLKDTERVFRTLRKFYPDHPTGSLGLDQLAKRARLSQEGALCASYFLSRSPAHLSIATHETIPRVTPNEQYVRLKDFEELKEITRTSLERPVEPMAMPGLGSQLERELLWVLEAAESEAVRDAWRKVRERLPLDPEGAITSGRALLEAGCKYVLEEAGETADAVMELPKLYKRAAEYLHLDARSDIDESLRRVLGACATIVDGVAHLRNRLSDAHGKDRNSAKPGRRHAEFIVLVAAAITGLLLSSQDAQRTL